MKYLKRLDVITEQPAVDRVRGYVVKLIEDPDLAALQVKINDFLTELPTLATPEVHLLSTEFRSYGTGGGFRHVAALTIYYIGNRQFTPL